MRAFTALLSAIVGLTLAGVAIGAKQQTTVDPKKIEPISLVDDGFTKTVEFYYQETVYGATTQFPGNLRPGEFFATDILNVGQANNWLGSFQAVSRARLGFKGDDGSDLCGGGPIWEWLGGLSISNELGALTFVTQGSGPQGSELFCDFNTVEIVYVGTGKGIYSCIESATLTWDRSDDVILPEDIPGFFTSQFSSPIDSIPEANKLLVTLEGPSDCF